MERVTRSFMVLNLLTAMLTGCSDGELSDSQSALDQEIVDVVQTSAQLASGASFTVSGSSSDSASSGAGPGKGRHGHPHRHRGLLDGISMLTPTDELLAIVDAESAGDFRGLRIAKNGGATITHYNATGEEVTLPLPGFDGPHGCSFSGKQFPRYDSILSTIAKTVIDYGAGVTVIHDTITIVRAGRIVITRTGSDVSRAEITTFEEYVVNGIRIEGTKTCVSTYDADSGSGISTTSVNDGKLTFSDGTTATWKTEKTRMSVVDPDEETGKAVSGEITTDVNTVVTGEDGAVLYSHKTAVPLVENLACRGAKHGPVSGTLETTYHDDIIVIDFGDGSCDSRTITITYNGVTTIKELRVSGFARVSRLLAHCLKTRASMKTVVRPSLALAGALP